MTTPHSVIGGFDRAGRWWVLALFGAGGAALGALLPLLAGWAADVRWVPFRGPLRFLGSFDQEWLVWGRPALGLLLGLAAAAWVIADSPVLEVDAGQIVVRRRGEVDLVIERARVNVVHRKGSKTVIEDARGEKLFEGDVEGGRTAIRDALLAHGYPWDGPRD
ncbi:hypothetical protein [Nocardioides sp. AE5]|uniref:YqeB family protein n=1 Tax=Nocardioides sp. AE5 TaxID=2962573 RepID=UPI0028813C06|nr:hypothetical protein [Nocardioides sp. AE5]MDT0200833.1 hypothetical protein [Nocardioides sp. AE5]